MKTRYFLVAISILLFQLSLSAQVNSPERVIQKVANKLASVKLLGYKYSFEFSYPSQGRTIKDKADAFLDLKPADKGSRFRFQFSGVERFSAYNGTERFTLDKKGKKIHVENNPTFSSFGDVFLMNSPIALKYALPQILADKTIQKSVTATSSAYVVEFGLRKGIFTADGEIVEIRPNHTNLYRITVNRTSLLPVEVVQSNDANDETVKTTYADITEKPTTPDASSWFYSSFLKDYTLQKKDKLTLIKAGTRAPAFELEALGLSRKVALDQFEGRVVLLEFWIAQCGFCIAAVPKLNRIAANINHGPVVLSVNMYDPPGTIDAFKKKYRPAYPILTGGDSIAAAYGVEAYPAIVLIDTQGEVVYSSSGLFEDELKVQIDSALYK